MATDLEQMRASLLKGLRCELAPDDGDEAFEKHMLLAARIHRAARLAQPASLGEGEGWISYFLDHFPEGRNGVKDARLLWRYWRTALLKDQTPGDGVCITHAQGFIHWRRDPTGDLCISLESMWDDFEYSVDHFIEFLERTPQRRTVALRRWHERSWTIRPFPVVIGSSLSEGRGVSASYTASGTAMGYSPRPK